jgi:hypothetical protein
MTTDLDRLIQSFSDYFINLYRKAPAGTPAAAVPADATPANAAPASPMPANANPASAGAAAADPAPANAAAVRPASASAPPANAALAATGSGGAFLAFEPIGKSLTPEMFALDTGDFSPLLAIEQFSMLANTLLVLDGTVIETDSISSADGLYELMLASALPLPTVDRGPFDMLRNNALEAFDRAKALPLLHDGREYRAAVATPPDWCAPSGVSAWTSKSFSQKQTTVVSTGVGTPPPPPPTPQRSWNWRVVPSELQPALASPTAAQRVMMQRRVAMQDAGELPPRAGMKPGAQVAMMRPQVAAPRSVMAAPMAVRDAGAAEPVITTARFSSAAVVAKPAMPVYHARPIIAQGGPDTLAGAAKDLNDASSSQQVTSKDLELSFDYCLVRATRPWLSPFLNMKTWYMQGSKAGEMASGTGTGRTPFEVIPMAALVIKNLKIVASWSQEDSVAMKSSTKLGPFSLLGRTVDEVSGSLTCPGMQIVAWICEPMPTLPPASDPALA